MQAPSLSDPKNRLKQLLAQRSGTDPNDWFLTFKARFAMACAYKVLADMAREHQNSKACLKRTEVITQLFTCVTALDPIVWAGLTPVYVDISPRTLAVDPDLVRFSESSCALVIQHTFGIIDEASDATLVRAAHEAGVVVVEDCAHCAGRMSYARDLPDQDSSPEPLCDISIHSFGVEKLLPTHFGGAIWINPRSPHKEFCNRLANTLSDLPDLDHRRSRAARCYLQEMRIINRLPAAPGRMFIGALKRVGLFEPAVSETEKIGSLFGEPALPSDWVANRAADALLAFNESVLLQRREHVAYYSHVLNKEGISSLRSVPGSDEVLVGTDKGSSQALLRYGVFFSHRSSADKAAALLKSKGIYAPRWYDPLLFPGVRDFQTYGLSPKEDRFAAYPLSVAAGAACVALPCDRDPSVIDSAIEIIKSCL